MGQLIRLVAAAAVAVLAVAPAWAQGFMPGMPMNPLQLMTEKAVREELKLSDDQVQKASEALKKQAPKREGLRDFEPEERVKKMNELIKEANQTAVTILKPEQMKRLREIHLQLQGPQAFHSPGVVRELKITDEQKEKIQELQKEAHKEMTELRKPGGDREKVLKRIEEISKANRDKILALLTVEQKAHWKQMTGEPFKGEIRFGPRPKQ